MCLRRNDVVQCSLKRFQRASFPSTSCPEANIGTSDRRDPSEGLIDQYVATYGSSSFQGSDPNKGTECDSCPDSSLPLTIPHHSFPSDCTYDLSGSSSHPPITNSLCIASLPTSGFRCSTPLHLDSPSIGGIFRPRCGCPDRCYPLP